MDAYRGAIFYIDDFMGAQAQDYLNNLISRVDNSIKQGFIKESDLKPNWQDFLSIIVEHNIRALYHFTDIKNVKHIKEFEGLLSQAKLEQQEIEVQFGGNDLSRDLDQSYGTNEYIHLSFLENHPMAYNLTQCGKHIVTFKITPFVILLKDTIFSDKNAASSTHKQGGDIQDFKNIDFNAIKKPFAYRDDPCFEKRQAEVMVKDFIPINCIRNFKNIWLTSQSILNNQPKPN